MKEHTIECYKHVKSGGTDCICRAAVAPQAPADAEELAKRFHDTYERLAPFFGYKTREESAKPWAEVPEKNRKLMIAVCASILERSWAAAVPAPGRETLQVLEDVQEELRLIRMKDTGAVYDPTIRSRINILIHKLRDSDATPKEG